MLGSTKLQLFVPGQENLVGLESDKDIWVQGQDVAFAVSRLCGAYWNSSATVVGTQN